MAVDIHARLRAMEDLEPVQGVSDLGAERADRTARNWSDPVRAGVSYFRVPDRRMERGRITLLENGQNASERVMYREYVILNRYGGYHGASHPADWQRVDVFLGIIQRGGIHEFDAQQLVDLCWHYRPGRDATDAHRLIWRDIDRYIGQGMTEADAVYTVMPQLVGRDLTIQTCEACGPERRFSTAESVRQHRAIMHKSDVQTLGTRDAIAQAIQQGNGGGADMTQLIDVMTQLVQQLAAAQSGSEPPRRGRPPKASSDDAE
jgi:hypothetical protein